MKTHRQPSTAKCSHPLPVSKVTVFGFMNPVIGVILSALLLNETESLGVSSVLALGLVCVGIYIVNAKDKD